jgi:hypothetical protein
VENAHSSVKAAIKRALAEPEIQRELDSPPPDTPLCQWRIMVLHRIAEDAMDEVTPAKCGGWFRQMLRHIPTCMAGDPVAQLNCKR